MTANKAEPKVLSADNILKALDQGAKSMTAVAKMLGYKSGSSGVLKKLIATVPDLAARLAAAAPAANKDAPKEPAREAKPKGKKTGAVAEKKPAGKAAFTIPDYTPFRHTDGKPSGYAMVWAILHAHKDTGISKADLVAKYKAWSGKADKNCGFDVHVVISPREDGASHRSAAKAAQSYWVQRENDFLRLRLIGEGNK